MTIDLSRLLVLLPSAPNLESVDALDDVSLHRAIVDDRSMLQFITKIVQINPHDVGLMNQSADCPDLLPHIRVLASALGLRWGQFLGHIASIAQLDQRVDWKIWKDYSKWVQVSPMAAIKTADVLRSGALGKQYEALEGELLISHPHAVYPTSPYRRSSGQTISNENGTQVEATMTSTLHTSIRVVEGVLDPDCDLLADHYRPLGRCVCVIDSQVEDHFGWHLEQYFAIHGIELNKLTYRAMEADKGTPTVERMLGDFKQLGVSRNEPVLVMGGGVLTDTAGLACSLYHRGTPYIMLSTSVVAGIDAGPSPRTCCDGFGYKNLFGAYHPPVLSITDRTFFKTLRPGWIRHGLAEVIKMAVVKDATLFELLESAGDDLIQSRFGTKLEASDESKD
ncbi:MAG: 3-dehydroquinate synthase, partial [Planctomycetota bacterium]